MFGLDISDASIEALELKKSFGKVKMVGYARMELPEGIVRDGIVLKKKELGEAIKKLLVSAKPYAIKSKEVILSLPESRVFTYIFKFPANLNLKQIFNILQFEVPNVMPVSFEEVYFDFVTLGKIDSEQEIFFVAVPKKVVNDLSEVAESIGLRPRIFDMESASFARAVGRAADNSVIVDIGARTTTISIFDKKGIRFTTNIGAAGNLFTETVAKKLKIKWEEAEKLKKTCGLLIKDEKCKAGKVFLIIQSVLQPILREIQTAIKFYEEKSGQKIKRVVLCGGSAMMPNIADYFKENLGLEVMVGSPALASKIKIEKEKINPLLLNVFGLALRGIWKKPEEGGINLIGLEKEAKKKVKKRRKFLLFGLILSLILFLGSISFYFFQNPQKIPFLGERFLPEIIPFQFNVKISTIGEQADVAGRLIEIEKEGSKIFPATGKRLTEGRAGGKVKIVNNSGSSQTLIATTRLLSEEDVLFRLKEQVTIPAGQTVEAEVYADAIGAAGDVGPGKFTFPGLSLTLQKLIYAEAEESMTGGAVETLAVGAEDIEQAKVKLLAELSKGAKSEVEKFLETGEILIPVILKSEILEATTSVPQDEVAEEFELRMKIKNKFLTVLENDLIKAFRTELSRQSIQKTEIYEFKNLQYFLISFNETIGLVTIKISAEAVKR